MRSVEPRGCPTPGACSCPSDRLIAVAPRMLALIQWAMPGGISATEWAQWAAEARAILSDVEG